MTQLNLRISSISTIDPHTLSSLIQITKIAFPLIQNQGHVFSACTGLAQ